MKRLLKTFAVVLLSFDWLYADEKPNIVLIIADDLGYGDIRLHGGVAQTPNIDRLAKEGVELQRYYTYPLCSPARAAILTGQMPRRFGITTALQARDPGLPAALPTLPRSLQSAGYQTMLVGKWHLGFASPPLQSGFDHFYGFLGPEIDYFKHTSRVGQVDWQRNGATIHEEGYSTFLLEEEAIRLLESRDTQRPFYMQVAFNAPHFPFAVPDEYSEKYGQLDKSSAIRAGMIEALDVAIGNILVVLDQENLRQNTLVLFLSDNGADQSGRNAPFRNAKGSVYEGGIHVPCIMRWPNELKADSVSPQVMSAQDWYPTLAGVAGIELSREQNMDGRNLWPALRSGGRIDRGPLLIAGTHSALFDGAWKFIQFSNGTMSLFHLDEDLSESTDLVSEQLEMVQYLKFELNERQKIFPALPTRSPTQRMRK